MILSRKMLKRTGDSSLGQSVDFFFVDVGWSVEYGIKVLCPSLQDLGFFSDQRYPVSAEYSAGWLGSIDHFDGIVEAFCVFPVSI